MQLNEFFFKSGSVLEESRNKKSKIKAIQNNIINANKITEDQLL